MCGMWVTIAAITPRFWTKNARLRVRFQRLRLGSMRRCVAKSFCFSRASSASDFKIACDWVIWKQLMTYILCLFCVRCLCRADILDWESSWQIYCLMPRICALPTFLVCAISGGFNSQLTKRYEAAGFSFCGSRCHCIRSIFENCWDNNVRKSTISESGL